MWKRWAGEVSLRLPLGPGRIRAGHSLPHLFRLVLMPLPPLTLFFFFLPPTGVVNARLCPGLSPRSSQQSRLHLRPPCSHLHPCALDLHDFEARQSRSWTRAAASCKCIRLGCKAHPLPLLPPPPPACANTGAAIATRITTACHNHRSRAIQLPPSALKSTRLTCSLADIVLQIAAGRPRRQNGMSP